jgi:DNA-binding protein HU-beta
MTKTELIEALAEKADLTKAEVARFISAFTETVTDEIKAGEKVTLTGFGTFSVSERSARKGRNPQTGEEIDIAASKLPKFKAGKGLKDKVA